MNKYIYISITLKVSTGNSLICFCAINCIARNKRSEAPQALRLMFLRFCSVVLGEFGNKQPKSIALLDSLISKEVNTWIIPQALEQTDSSFKHNPAP